MEICSPIANPKQISHTLCERPSSLRNLTIGLLDNTKKNADLLLAQLGALCEQKYENIKVKRYRKPNSSTPYQQIDRIANECDLVIHAHGD
jgi:hypothetical protein